MKGGGRRKNDVFSRGCGNLRERFTQIEMSFNTIIGFGMSPESDGLGHVLLCGDKKYILYERS